MIYASIALLALLIQIIINPDVLFKRNEKVPIPEQEKYRRFLFATIFYYVTDALWGILDSAHLVRLLYLDTVVYYIAMAGAVLLWTQYVIGYLGEKNKFSDFLMYAGQIFFAYELVFLVVNFFYPVFFYFDEVGVYHAGYVRYMALIIQIALFFLTSLYTFFVAARTEGAVKRRNYTTAFFGIFMVIFIAIQYFYPLLPIYSMSYMIGCCVLHTFVVEGVREEYRKELEQALERERAQKAELGSARRLAYTDSLTGVKSKHAYVEKEEQIDLLISGKKAGSFGVVVFDLNGLKEVNDTRGHDTGDEYIIEACRLICECFKRSPVYRIGGDEFVAVIDGEDYANRAGILGGFDMRIENNLKNGRVVVATGMAEFDPVRDNCYKSVFERADSIMYQRKKILKQMGAM